MSGQAFVLDDAALPHQVKEFVNGGWRRHRLTFCYTDAIRKSD